MTRRSVVGGLFLNTDRRKRTHRPQSRVRTALLSCLKVWTSGIGILPVSRLNRQAGRLSYQPLFALLAFFRG